MGTCKKEKLASPTVPLASHHCGYPEHATVPTISVVRLVSTPAALAPPDIFIISNA